MTEVTINQGTQRASIFYLINPATSIGDVVVSSSASGSIAASVIALNSVGGVVDTETGVTSGNPAGNSLNLTYSTLDPGAFVVGAFSDNSFGSAAVPPSVSGGAIDTTVLVLEADTPPWSPASTGQLHAYGDIPVAGTYTDTYVAGRQNRSDARNAAAAVVFEAIPEPTTPSLLYLGAIGLLARRRWD